MVILNSCPLQQKVHSVPKKYQNIHKKPLVHHNLLLCCSSINLKCSQQSLECKYAASIRFHVVFISGRSCVFSYILVKLLQISVTEFVFGRRIYEKRKLKGRSVEVGDTSYMMTSASFTSCQILSNIDNGASHSYTATLHQKAPL